MDFILALLQAAGIAAAIIFAFFCRILSRRLGADGNATRRFHLSGVQYRRSPPWLGNPKDFVRSRQFRVTGRSNPDALIDAFFELESGEACAFVLGFTCGLPANQDTRR